MSVDISSARTRGASQKSVVSRTNTDDNTMQGPMNGDDTPTIANEAFVIVTHDEIDDLNGDQSALAGQVQNGSPDQDGAPGQDNVSPSRNEIDEARSSGRLKRAALNEAATRANRKGSITQNQ